MSRSRKNLELALTAIDVENTPILFMESGDDNHYLSEESIFQEHNVSDNTSYLLINSPGPTNNIQIIENDNASNSNYQESNDTISGQSDFLEVTLRNKQPGQTDKSTLENMSVIVESDQLQDENVQSLMEISDESMKTPRLVPYSDHSDSDTNFEDEKPQRRRRRRFQVNKCTWTENKNKKNRECGVEYYGRKKENKKWKKVMKSARKLNTRCKCNAISKNALKCSLFNEYDRQTLFDQFWAMTWNEKKIFVNNLVHLIPVKRERDRKHPTTSRRNCSVLYHLRKENELMRVCKTMFLNTLSIGRGTVLKWKNDREPFKEVDENNIHVVKKNKIRLRAEHSNLNEFINSLPVMESHYCRRSSNRSYLLPEWSSMRALYNFYANDWCLSQNVKPLSVFTFNNALSAQNISIFTLKKDACEKCAAHKLGHVTDIEYNMHTERKKEAREEKEKDINQEKHVFTVDLQAVLLCPRSNVSSLYYKTKLTVHNLCIYNNKNKDGFCYLWNEAEGGVNSQEFASILISFIEEQIKSGYIIENDTIIIYSDGCTYQNRNQILANALLNLLIMKNIEIQQKFLEVGHTQMEVDAMHSTIERHLKQKIINVPAEYIRICANARQKPKPYFVRYLLHDFFKSFKEIPFYSTIRPGKMKGDPKVTDLRAIKYLPNGFIFYKLRFSDNWTELPQRKNTNICGHEFEGLQPLYSHRLPIKKRKYEDLQQLKHVLPTDFHDFFDNLPHD